ncbi:MAG: CPBP family glutamic-type intramembrane protease [Planctomycetota bacterium]
MSPAQRDLLVRLGAAVAATLVLAPVAGALLLAVPFHRVMTRLFLGALVIAFVVKRGHPRTWPDRLRAMGLSGPERGRRFAAGVSASILLTVLLLAVSWALGGRTGAVDEPPLLGLHVLKAALAAIVVSFLEEILCRGYFLDVIGGVPSALVYAAVHYFRPLHTSAPAEGFDPLLGVKRLPDLWGAFFGDGRSVTLGIFSLFVFGLALNRLRERTGTLYLGIGLHAGLVFILALYPRFLTSHPSAAAWIHGGGRLHDGLIGALMLGLLLLAAHRLPLPGFCTRRNT